MKKIMLKISTAGAAPRVIAEQCIHARDFFGRLVGLLSHSSLPAGHGMLIEPCKQVHTFFMQFPIDVVFLSSENRIVEISEMKAWRLSKFHFKAVKVLEIPVGTCRKLSLQRGEQLEITQC